MAEVILEDQQAALILTGTNDSIQVDMAYEGQEGLAAGLCEVIARKLIEDEGFRDDLLAQIQLHGAGDD